MKKIVQVLCLSIVVIAFNSCDKYDEGGAKKKSTANLTNVWEIESYMQDGTDKTSELLITNFNETFADNGTYARFYSNGAGDEISETGSWTLVEDNANVNFSGGGTYDLTTGVSGVSTSTYVILKLTKKKFWYSFTAGTISHEFHMIPKS